jgi:hypothetical protein
MALDASQSKSNEGVMDKKTCGSIKMGEFNMLHCCREAGHTGYHNYVVGELISDLIKRERALDTQAVGQKP